MIHVLVLFPEQSGSPHGHRQEEPGEALFQLVPRRLGNGARGLVPRGMDARQHGRGRAELGGDARAMHHRLRVVAVHMEDRKSVV